MIRNTTRNECYRCQRAKWKGRTDEHIRKKSLASDGKVISRCENGIACHRRGIGEPSHVKSIHQPPSEASPVKAIHQPPSESHRTSRPFIDQLRQPASSTSFGDPASSTSFGEPASESQLRRASF